ncbi:fatty acid-binding protein DegV [Heyndrickxia shackletonii]|uniref:Fatty acid-binding protein DegV n=1 Tax=Heyndrickxia shackletonii TaxID=157838 RepID=A0A0Q3WZU0_9BACI|nr:DegV family protein [Heyndrickxia shackletonii]KQL55005.1 fatty acid-binding protein DegV [Heyndrickxia shackletonii]NEZ01493.1 DegV family protein [Heyndrickxia shackletonii]
MTAIKLFADSACDLPLEFFEENNVTLIPLNVYMDDKEYLDIKTINPKQIFDGIRSGKVPKTSQPSPEVFEQVFTDLAKSKQTGIYIAFSSALSGTYQTAEMVRGQLLEEYPDLDLTIIDSKCASVGYGLVVKNAASMLKANATKEQIIEASIFNSQHMEHLFTVDDLDYLAKGGRLSKASAFLGGLLNIKPLLHVEDGKLIPLEKLRGKKKVLQRMLDLMGERGERLQDQCIGICHGDDEEAALNLKNLIEERFGVKEFYINIIGSAVGSHAGPGTLAVFFLNKRR